MPTHKFALQNPMWIHLNEYIITLNMHKNDQMHRNPMAHDNSFKSRPN